MEHTRQRWGQGLLAILTSLLFAGSFVAGKYTTDEMGPLLITLLREVNGAIGDDDYHIGISFFLGETADLPAVWQTEIEPYLEEVLFDRPDTLGRYRWEKIIQSHQLGA